MHLRLGGLREDAGVIPVSTVDTPGGVAKLLQRLSTGEEIAFLDRGWSGRESTAFFIQRHGQSYELRDARGTPIATVSSFAEAWRRRPRPDRIAP